MASCPCTGCAPRLGTRLTITSSEVTASGPAAVLTRASISVAFSRAPSRVRPPAASRHSAIGRPLQPEVQGAGGCANVDHADRLDLRAARVAHFCIGLMT